MGMGYVNTLHNLLPRPYIRIRQLCTINEASTATISSTCPNAGGDVIDMNRTVIIMIA